MKNLIRLLVLVVFLGSFTSVVEAKRDNAEYEQLAEKIIDRVKGLRKYYIHLAKIDEGGEIVKRDDTFWIVFKYEYGTKWISNPEYDVFKYNEDRVRAFDRNKGIYVRLDFFKGPWLGDPKLHLRSIEELNITVTVEGRDKESINRIRQTIYDIIAEERKLIKQ